MFSYQQSYYFFSLVILSGISGNLLAQSQPFSYQAPSGKWYQGYIIQKWVKEQQLPSFCFVSEEILPHESPGIITEASTIEYLSDSSSTHSIRIVYDSSIQQHAFRRCSKNSQPCRQDSFIVVPGYADTRWRISLRHSPLKDGMPSNKKVVAVIQSLSPVQYNKSVDDELAKIKSTSRRCGCGIIGKGREQYLQNTSTQRLKIKVEVSADHPSSARWVKEYSLEAGEEIYLGCTEVAEPGCPKKTFKIISQTAF